MRRLTLILALVSLGLSEGHEPVRFIHPKRALVLAGPGGVEIPVQTLVEPHPENREFRLAWDGEHCGGASSKALDGEYERGLQPLEPLKVRVGHGVCTFAATVFGPGGKIRVVRRLEVRVCGGGDDCTPAN